MQQTLSGVTFPFARYVTTLIDPFVVALLRFVISSSVLLIIAHFIARHPRSRPIERADRRRIVTLGVMIVILNQTLYLLGQSYTSSGHGGILFSLTPVFVYLIALKYLKEPPSRAKALGIALTIIGAIIIFFERGFVFDRSYMLGDAIILVAVVAWAYYTVWGKPLVEKYDAIRVTAYALASGTVVYLPFGIYRFLQADLSALDTYGWIAILYLALGTSVVVYCGWYWLLRYMEASRVAVLTNLQPIVAGLLGLHFLNEAITIPFIIAAAIILVGVTITQRA